MNSECRFDIGAQRDARDAEAIVTWSKLEKLGLLIEDVEFYRPFYDEVGPRGTFRQTQLANLAY